MIKDWRGSELEKLMKERLSRNMRQASLFVKGQVQRAINRGNADGQNPSLPGEPPKKVTGRLFQSIVTDQRESALEITGVIGTNVEYAKRLEYGFTGTDSNGSVVDQAPRPYLRPGISDNLPAIKAILVKP